MAISRKFARMARSSDLRPGDHVRSVQVGCREAFTGVVAAFGHSDRDFFHVRDSRGRLWSRTPAQLILVSKQTRPKG